MKKQPIAAALVLAAGVAGAPLLRAEPAAAEPESSDVRTIRLVQDDGQVRIVSKLYELKYIKATDIRPFLEAAVKRYSSASTVERVNYPSAKRQMFLVSTGEDFIPYVDDLVAGLDRPGKQDQYGSIVEGTGVTRVTYTPRYRAAEDIIRIINEALRSPEGYAFLNKDTNTIYWKDDRQAALNTLTWVKYLDRPLPQVNVRLNCYEVRESDLRDIGLDYLAWRNGPGLNLFSVGYDGGRLFSNEAFFELVSGAYQLADLTRNFSTSWGYGGFLTAPQFDLSFVRLLQQSGNAKLSASADLTFVNTPFYEDDLLGTHLPKLYTVSLVPGYENIVKDGDDRSSIVPGGDSDLMLTICDPVICFAATAEETGKRGEIPATEDFYHRDGGGVVFSYQLISRTINERSNRGDELGSASTASAELTLAFNTEKLLASYARDQEVEQTVGLPFLVKIPILKYLFGTTTAIHEKTYIIVTAEAHLVHPEMSLHGADASTLPKESER